jgi:hypothetical protein
MDASLDMLWREPSKASAARTTCLASMLRDRPVAALAMGDGLE